MTGQELEAAGIELYGEGWKTSLANALQIERTTLFKMRQRDKIPGPVAVAVAMLLKAHRARVKRHKPKDMLNRR